MREDCLITFVDGFAIFLILSGHEFPYDGESPAYDVVDIFMCRCSDARAEASRCKDEDAFDAHIHCAIISLMPFYICLIAILTMRMYVICRASREAGGAATAGKGVREDAVIKRAVCR